ncbi:MAG: YvcK family protein [Anaerolineae bacterium]|nr:YvcK family protein [Anaerolineae bacterium]
MRAWDRMRAYTWFRPGLGIKRWLVLIAVGGAVAGLGLSLLAARAVGWPGVVPGWGAVLVLAVGGAAIVAGLVGVNRVLLAPFARGDASVIDVLYRHRQRERGPKVVAIGGGHGLATLLRGLKAHTSNITAIVTVADDGGSSGRLRRALGVLPPGDFRNCIAALADDEALTTQLFQYRFPATSESAGVDGHTVGNLFITAMADVTGSFERAVVESSKVLAIQGQVLPSTLESVTLVGDLRAESVGVSRVAGESHITHAAGSIERVMLEPDDVRAYPGAVRAILDADLIVAGPGSLYTSVLPNLLVREIARAIAASRAVRVYVCNVATQKGETDGYAVGDHVAALERHVGGELFPIVLANANFDRAGRLPPDVEMVKPDPARAGYVLHALDLVDPLHPWRHDGKKLAHALIRLLEQERA